MKKLNVIKGMASTVLMATMVLSPIAPVMAAETTGTLDSATSSRTQTVSVTLNKASTLSYSVPTNIELNDGSGYGTFKVGVMGDIRDDEAVIFKADSEFHISHADGNKDVLMMVQFEPSDKNINSAITVKPTEISDSAYVYKNGNIITAASEYLKAGDWSGTFNLEIKKVEYEN